MIRLDLSEKQGTLSPPTLVYMGHLLSVYLSSLSSCLAGGDSGLDLDVTDLGLLGAPSAGRVRLASPVPRRANSFGKDSSHISQPTCPHYSLEFFQTFGRDATQAHDFTSSSSGALRLD